MEAVDDIGVDSDSLHEVVKNLGQLVLLGRGGTVAILPDVLTAENPVGLVQDAQHEVAGVDGIFFRRHEVLVAFHAFVERLLVRDQGLGLLKSDVVAHAE